VRYLGTPRRLGPRVVNFEEHFDIIRYLGNLVVKKSYGTQITWGAKFINTSLICGEECLNCIVNSQRLYLYAYCVHNSRYKVNYKRTYIVRSTPIVLFIFNTLMVIDNVKLLIKFIPTASPT